MHSFHSNPLTRSSTRAQQLREAVLFVFCDPVPTEFARLRRLSPKEWQDLLRWLDTSGLALYFLSRLEELGLLDALPFPVLVRLRQNLVDNSERIHGMITESVAIQRCFQHAKLPYAVLKGFSLWPISVPKLELRSQLDQDFLVPEQCATQARQILEGFGYRLGAMSGMTWEFKATDDRPSSLGNLYRAGASRSAELHLETFRRDRLSLLSRSQKVPFHGVLMPVLSPVDLFLWQGLHVYKHVCSEFSRAAHILEFRRHVIARFQEDAFWGEVQEQVAGEPQTRARLGALILVITRVMGPFAPEMFTRWTVDRLPVGVGIWVDRYAQRTVLASFPGTKLYLLLQRELEPAGIPAKRSLGKVLLPRRLPPAIAHGAEGEGHVARIRRHLRQLRFILFRLRFHIQEGFHYLYELILWQQYRSGVSQ